MVNYEWCYEEIDENGDVVDMECQSSLSDLVGQYPLEGICLIRRIGNGIDKEKDREYVYIIGGRLPNYFGRFTKVPNRFHKELREVKNSQQ